MNILLVKRYYHLIKKIIIELAKFTYSPLGKDFEKQIKAIEDKGEKQIKAIEDNRKQLISDDDYKNQTINFKRKRNL